MAQALNTECVEAGFYSNRQEKCQGCCWQKKSGPKGRIFVDQDSLGWSLVALAAALDEADQDHDDGDDQEDVDQSAHGVAAHKAKQPEDDEDNGDGIHSGLRRFEEKAN